MHTHTGYRRADGGENACMYAKRQNKDGKTHALVEDGGGWFLAICGKWVYNETRDMYGDPRYPNVRPAAEGLPVDCAKCRKLIAK